MIVNILSPVRNCHDIFGLVWEYDIFISIYYGCSYSTHTCSFGQVKVHGWSEYSCYSITIVNTQYAQLEMIALSVVILIHQLMLIIMPTIQHTAIVDDVVEVLEASYLVISTQSHPGCS